MQKLCDRCIRALRSRGEAILIGYIHVDNINDSCSWCEKSDTDLYEVMISPFGRDFGGI
jgi:hypothetical protein